MSTPLATVFAQGTAGTGSTVAACPGGMTVALTDINGKSVSSLAVTYLGINDCNNNVTLNFQLNGIPPALANVDVWVGESCAGMDRHNATTTPCQYVKTVVTNGHTERFNVPLEAKQIVQAEETDCGSGGNSQPKIWFLALDNAGESSTEAATACAAYTALQVDLAPPPSPTSVTGGRGGSEIPVSWKTGDVHIEGYIVYVDSSGMSAETSEQPDAATSSASDTDGGSETSLDAGGGISTSMDSGQRVDLPGGSSAMCGPTLLVAGQPPADLPGLPQLKRKTINNRNSSSTNVFPSDLIGAQTASVAVTAVDLAGNESALSNVVCVEVVPTTGFLDAYRQQGGGDVTGCPCSAMGPVQMQNALPVGLSVLALLWSRRKRYS